MAERTCLGDQRNLDRNCLRLKRPYTRILDPRPDRTVTVGGGCALIRPVNSKPLTLHRSVRHCDYPGIHRPATEPPSND